MGLVKFGDYVKEVKINIDRNNNPYEYYVAGDHMDSEDLTIRRKGLFATDDVGPAFTRLFKPGQILYGSRRTYLKKVAVADFEGICSNTTFVLETKDENKLRQRLLPFIILTDDFTKWSISKSKGSTNPYILFSDLANYEFELPDINKQDELVKLLWQAYATKESYREMIRATDEMVKSQFIEMFGNNETNPKGFMRKPISEVATLINGRAYSAKELLQFGKYRVLRVGNFFSTSDFYYSDLELEPNKYCEKGDLLYAWSATFGARIWEEEKVIYHYHIWKVEYDNKLLDKEFLCFLLNEMTENLKRDTHGSTMMHLTKEGMERKQIIIPPIGNQNSFVSLLHQADKSKFELKQAIEKIDNVMRALMQ